VVGEMVVVIVTVFGTALADTTLPTATAAATTRAAANANGRLIPHSFMTPLPVVSAETPFEHLPP
jgi:hypothetical protein